MRVAFYLFVLFSFSFNTPASDTRLESVLIQAQKNILSKRIGNNRWDMPAYIGSHYVSMHYLTLRWIGKSTESFPTERFQEKLLKEQLPTGGWKTVRDHFQSRGDLDASLFHYLFLKASGISTESVAMKKAKRFIRRQGGIRQARVFTKLFFSAFGNYSWDDVVSVPLWLFHSYSPIGENSFAQWIWPHMIPIAYLRNLKCVRNLGPEFQLPEFDQKPVPQSSQLPPARPERYHGLVQLLLERQQPTGSWGGYAIASFLSLMVLDDYQSRWPNQQDDSLQRTKLKALSFVRETTLNNRAGNLNGVVTDGHYWDTSLLALALARSGYSATKLGQTAEYLVENQNENGGFSFGKDFWYAPDTDDTSLTVLFLSEIQSHSSSRGRAIQWLLSLQNSDGGWGAFAHNNYPLPGSKWLLGDLADSTDLFDESSADIVGHVLEAIASDRKFSHWQEAISKAHRYLEQTQKDNGAWTGRWAVADLYGTSQALVGLYHTGFNSNHPMIQKALKFLVENQNEDGGFGETSQTDLAPSFSGQGPSTPTQTAWVLQALLEDYDRNQESIEKAIEYLLDEFEKNNRWVDGHTVGTGHPGIVYMEYPSYPYAFPLLALAKYLSKR